MIVVLGIVGALLGGMLLSGYSSGVLIGAALGLLAGWLLTLNRKLDELRKNETSMAERLDLLQEQIDRGVRRGPAFRDVHVEAPLSPERGEAPAPGGAIAPAEPTETPADGAAGEPTLPARATASPRQPRPGPMPPPMAPSPAAESTPREPDLIERGVEFLKHWFTSGNVPVKVGVIVSIFGVAFLIKEAVDRQWLVVPIELRLVGVALFGLVLLVIGWRLRTKRPVYAQSVQGGGIAIVYLTIYAAFALYGLLPAVLAFALLVIVTAASGALAVLQDSLALAVLGIVGGFAAPVLASSGQGNHVILFSYYAVLNAAVFGISWFKAWRLLNVLGFAFTFVIGTAWGYLAYEPEQLWSTEPFLVLFVLMYTVIPVLFASRESPRFHGYVDGTLVFGTPVIGFGLQTQLIGETEYGLAISAIALAALYIGVATYLFKRRAPELRVLTESFWSLSVVFLAIAMPLALNARWTSVAWSLQGAAMVWLGVRQHRRLALAAGIVLQLAAAAAYSLQPIIERAEIPILNGYYLGALLIALAGFASSWIFDHYRGVPQKMYEQFAVWAFFAWGALWWLGAGIDEIDAFASIANEAGLTLAFSAATVWIAMAIARLLDWQRLITLGLVLVPAMAFVFLWTELDGSHPLVTYGWLAWPVAIATHFAFLRWHEQQFDRLSSASHAVGYWIIAAVIAAEASWWVDRWTSGVWALATALGGVAALILGTVQSRRLLAWPVDAHWRVYVLGCTGVTLAALCLVTFGANLFSPGDPEPLPYIPVINPLELAILFVITTAYVWYAEASRELGRVALEARGRILAPVLLALFLLTMTVARSVHHWSGVPFDLESLAASDVLQAALSIVWGAAGLAGMIAGARMGRRSVWMAGSGLMAVVVIKLFLVDLGDTGTVTRVISFLGVGILLLIVGYFAPVPPRDVHASETAEQSE